MLSALVELDSRARDEVFDRPRDQDLAGGGQGRHPGRDVDGEPSEVIPADLALAGVQTRPDLKAEPTNGLADLLAASNGSRRSIEGGDEPVSGGVELPTTEAAELVANSMVMGVEHGPPIAVTE